MARKHGAYRSRPLAGTPAGRMRYVKANAETKKLWNQAFVEEIHVRDRLNVNVTWAEPFRTLMTVRRGVSDKKLLVVLSGRLSNREFRSSLAPSNRGNGRAEPFRSHVRTHRERRTGSMQPRHVSAIMKRR